MNHRLTKPALYGTLFAFTACGVAASRAPLGGNYAVSESSSARDRTATSATAVAAAEPAPDPTPAPEAASAARALALPVDAGAPVPANANLLRYDPLKVGDKIKIELGVSFDLSLEAGHQDVIPGDGKLGIEAKYRFELKVTQASAQTLDELEVTVTPLAMRTHYGAHTTEAPLEAGEKFQVTLGRSPSVKAPHGSATEEEGRAALLLVCTTLADFHEHWARSPTLELKSGWSSKSPISVPPVLNSHGAVLQAGPFIAKLDGRDASADSVPFQLALPISYAAAMGKLDLDLTGVARLSTAQARPLSIDLSGPARGSGGPRGELSAHGLTKLNATFSYP